MSCEQNCSRHEELSSNMSAVFSGDRDVSSNMSVVFSGDLDIESRMSISQSIPCSVGRNFGCDSGYSHVGISQSHSDLAGWRSDLFDDSSESGLRRHNIGLSSSNDFY